MLAAPSHAIDTKLVFLENSAHRGQSAPFEYPHDYTPTPLAQDAASNLQERLKLHLPELTQAPKGRMFGVLVVQTANQRLGYLSAYSGELQPELEALAFVPPVFQLPKGADFPEMAAIRELGREISARENSGDFVRAQAELKRMERETEGLFRGVKRAAKEAKAERQRQRENAAHLAESERQELFEKLAHQSAIEKLERKRTVAAQKLRLEEARAAVEQYNGEIKSLKARRKAASAALQEAIFRSYALLNSSGEQKDVRTAFTDFGVDVPPAGAGECAAPKLFQYAFQHHLNPVALAEFWWGGSPQSVVREHGRFYPACRRKCEPILAFMLKGMAVKPNPQLAHSGADQEVKILHEDAHVVVVNKPAGLLSVPGKHVRDSVQTRIQHLNPKATGPLIVHRLDRDTSGVMVLALSKAAHKHLQKQFRDRTVHKTYVAMLEKAIEPTSGQIDLPLTLDVDRRPMQMVDRERGKPAKTIFKVLERNANRTLIELRPVTGRAHQLRVHCAHQMGLHAPILGDNLYGSPAKRLYLHAEHMAFTHPITNQPMEVKAERPFRLGSL